MSICVLCLLVSGFEVDKPAGSATFRMCGGVPNVAKGKSRVEDKVFSLFRFFLNHFMSESCVRSGRYVR